MQPLSQQHKIEDPNIISYMTLRKAIGWMGFLLPIVLVFGSFILDHTHEIKGSLSGYYWTHTRNVLVGALCVMGGFLLSYHGPKGIKSLDSVASKLAGAFAICVAFVPTSQHGDDALSDLVHYLASAFFLAILAFMSLFLFTKSGQYITGQKKNRNRVFKICGITMLVAITLIPISGLNFIHVHIGKYKPTVVFETIALISFGISWLVKGELIFRDDNNAELVKRDG